MTAGVGCEFTVHFSTSFSTTRLPRRGLNLLERRLVDSHSTVTIPFDQRVLFISSLNCAEFSSRLSEVAQPLDPISGSQFMAGGRGFGERWSLGTV
jgi:hypothetical protein